MPSETPIAVARSGIRMYGAELATLHVAAAATAERAWSILAKHDEIDLQGVSCSDCHRGCLPHDRLMVNPPTFTVEWHDRRCDLGPSILFKLIQRLARRPGRYFTYDILMEDVWGQRYSARGQLAQSVLSLAADSLHVRIRLKPIAPRPWTIDSRLLTLVCRVGYSRSIGADEVFRVDRPPQNHCLSACKRYHKPISFRGVAIFYRWRLRRLLSR